MRKINKTDRTEIDNFCEVSIKHRTSANFFSSPEVLYNYAGCGNLYISESTAGIFVFADAGGFFRLYYVLTDISADIPPELCGNNIKPVVIETAYRGNNPPQSADYFTRHGFERALTRSRMNITVGATLAVAPNRAGASSAPTVDINAVLNLFEDSFDKYTGCIPALSELQKASEENRVIAITQDNILCGALLYENAGSTATLSNIAVAANMRGHGYGGQLVSSWIAICADAGKSVLRLWVADNNIPAVKLYEKHGFKPDGLKSVVMIKK